MAPDSGTLVQIGSLLGVGYLVRSLFEYWRDRRHRRSADEVTAGTVGFRVEKVAVETFQAKLLALQNIIDLQDRRIVSLFKEGEEERARTESLRARTRLLEEEVSQLRRQASMFQIQADEMQNRCRMLEVKLSELNQGDF